MSLRIIETGGKQYLVREGDTITIEKLLGVKSGQDVSFDKVLLADDGTKTEIGSPYLAHASVKAEVVEEGRARKIEVIKYKAKSRYFKLRGHRHPFMKVKIVGF